MKRLEIQCPSSCRIDQSRLSKGFTMMEVMIVVLILSILAVAGIPALNATFDHARLSAATEEAVNALQYAQLTAMTSGRPTRVVIGHLSNRIGVRQYTLSGDLFAGGNELVSSDVEGGNYQLMDYPLKKGTKYPILFDSEDRFRGIDIATSDFDSDHPLGFDTVGSPSHGGTAKFTLGGQWIVLTVDALTGKVSLSE